MDSTAGPLARSWWLIALVGALNVIIGVLAITHPSFTLTALGIVLGFYLLLAAIVAIVEGIAGATESRTFSIVIGIVALIAGVICIRRPGDSLLAIVIVVGIYLIVEGVFRLATAFQLPPPRTIPILIALIDLVLGVLILALPHESLGTLAVLAGIAMLIRGLFDLAAAWQVRKLRDTGPDATPSAAGLAT